MSGVRMLRTEWGSAQKLRYQAANEEPRACSSEAPEASAGPPGSRPFSLSASEAAVWFRLGTHSSVPWPRRHFLCHNQKRVSPPSTCDPCGVGECDALFARRNCSCTEDTSFTEVLEAHGNEHFMHVRAVFFGNRAGYRRDGAGSGIGDATTKSYRFRWPARARAWCEEPSAENKIWLGLKYTRQRSESSGSTSRAAARLFRR